MEFLHPAMWYWFRQLTAPCNVACGSAIVTVNSPSGSRPILQRDTWLWNDVIEFAMWQHPVMWHVALESWQWIRPLAAHCNVTRSSGIMALNSPRVSTLQCGRWLWDEMLLNSPKGPPYCNSTSGFNFGHITAVDMPFCTSLRNFIQIGPASAEKNDVMSIFKMEDLRHLGFYGSNNGFFENPVYDFL